MKKKPKAPRPATVGWLTGPEPYPLVALWRALPAEYEVSRLRATAEAVWRDSRVSFALFRAPVDIPYERRTLGARLDVVPGLPCRVVGDHPSEATVEVNVHLLLERTARVPAGSTFRLVESEASDGE